jgi:hypothetical protein
VFCCISITVGFLVEAPGLSSRFDGKSTNKALDLQFEERLEAVKRYNCITCHIPFSCPYCLLCIGIRVHAYYKHFPIKVFLSCFCVCERVAYEI